MKKIVSVILCIILVLSVSGCGGDKGPKEITILTLENYLPEDQLKEFTKSTGIAVNNVTVSTYEEIQAAVEQNPASYDLVIACDYVMDALVKGNHLQEINYKKFDNYKYVMPGFTGKYYDPDNKFTVPYAAVGVLIGYNPAKAGIIIDSYADLLAPDLKNSIVFTDDAEAIVGVANMALNYAPDYYVEHMPDVAKILTTMAGNYSIASQKFAYAEDALIDGIASVGVLYSTQLGYVVASNPDIEVVYPKEGFNCSIDSIAITSGADAKDAAMKFINYAHDPAVNGKLTQEIAYSSTNISGKQFMDEEYRNDGYNIKNDKAETGIIGKPLSEPAKEKFTTLYKAYFLKKVPSAETGEAGETGEIPEEPEIIQ
ncbi:MAG: extracellular solute-binding protein [Clostridia bacterium]|nr:extracellular solute-binding protein [Clostridia bacterium]